MLFCTIFWLEVGCLVHVIAVCVKLGVATSVLNWLSFMHGVMFSNWLLENLFCNISSNFFFTAPIAPKESKPMTRSAVSFPLGALSFSWYLAMQIVVLKLWCPGQGTYTRAGLILGTHAPISPSTQPCQILSDQSERVWKDRNTKFEAVSTCHFVFPDTEKMYTLLTPHKKELSNYYLTAHTATLVPGKISCNGIAWVAGGFWKRAAEPQWNPTLSSDWGNRFSSISVTDCHCRCHSLDVSFIPSLTDPLSPYLSSSFFLYLSICLSVRLSVCLSVCLSICLSCHRLPPRVIFRRHAPAVQRLEQQPGSLRHEGRL